MTVRVLVIAVFFLALLPANALARPATVDEAVYYGEVQGMMAIMSPSLARVSDLLSAPDATDINWQVELIAETRIWSAVYEAHLSMAVPPAFAEFDEHLSDSLESSDLAAKSYERSIRGQSASDARLANSYLSDAVSSLEAATVALPDIDFPSATAEASAEAEEQGSSTPLFMDASCDEGTFGTSIEVTEGSWSVLASGEGAAFVCFDLAAAEWAITIDCPNDTTGLAEFGTSEQDAVPLIPGTPQLLTFPDPIEAKLLVTCLRDWSFEAVRQ